LRLSDRERGDLVAFLHTLSDPMAHAWRPPGAAARCR
jgi:hypothetical protein